MRQFLTVVVALCISALMGGVAPAAQPTGYARLSSQANDGQRWLYLSGQADGPVQGMLFYPSSSLAGHLDVLGTGAFPLTYAYGQYGGCVYAYNKTGSNFIVLGPNRVSSCSVPGSRYTNAPGHSPTSSEPTREQFLYCTRRAANSLCTSRGAYNENAPETKDPRTKAPYPLGSPANPLPNDGGWHDPHRFVYVPASCKIWGNVGAQDFTGSATPRSRPSDQLSFDPAPTGRIAGVVRYVTKNMEYAMVNFEYARNAPAKAGGTPIPIHLRPPFLSVGTSSMTYGFVSTACL